MTDELQSPCLQALQAALPGRGDAALAEFWQEREELGTPLIEPEEGGTHSLVTFLWRANPPVGSVAIIGSIGESADTFPSMQRLGDTDLWYATVRLRNDCRMSYYLSPDHPLTPIREITDWSAEVARWAPDPLNPNLWVTGPDPDDEQIPEFRSSIVELPDAPHQPWIQRRDGTAAGSVERHRLTSAILEDERSLYVYTPPGYDPHGEPYDLLVLFDGHTYIDSVPTPVILDTLIAEDRIPPMVAVSIANTSMEARSVHLPCHPPFAEFLATELMPWVRSKYHVTADPEKTVVGGSSYGGLASTYAALQHPEIFGNVLSQSGSYWWAPEDDTEPEWLAREFARRPRLPIRFYMDVGLLENITLWPDKPSQLMANRHFRDVLQAREYPLTYVEYMGGHDYVWWRGTLADGLLALRGNTDESGQSQDH